MFLLVQCGCKARVLLPCCVWYVLFLTQGGLKAVVWTDVFQVGIMVAGFSSVIIRAVVVQEGIERIVNDSYHGGRLNFWEWVCTCRWCASLFLQIEPMWLTVKLNCFWRRRRGGVVTQFLYIFRQAYLVWGIFFRFYTMQNPVKSKTFLLCQVGVLRIHFGFHWKWMVNRKGQSYLYLQFAKTWFGISAAELKQQGK